MRPVTPFKIMPRFMRMAGAERPVKGGKVKGLELEGLMPRELV
jgi:hypothetical protein